jgi:hypothetical protein
MESKYTRYVSFCIGKTNIRIFGLIKLKSWNIGVDFLGNGIAIIEKGIVIKVPIFWIYVCWRKHESKENARQWMKFYNEYHKKFYNEYQAKEE